MPAVSKAQQHFMGMVHATQKGSMKAPSKQVAQAARTISKSDAGHFAGTKTKGLPAKKAGFVSIGTLKRALEEISVRDPDVDGGVDGKVPASASRDTRADAGKLTPPAKKPADVKTDDSPQSRTVEKGAASTPWGMRSIPVVPPSGGYAPEKPEKPAWNSLAELFSHAGVKPRAQTADIPPTDWPGGPADVLERIYKSPEGPLTNESRSPVLDYFLKSKASPPPAGSIAALPPPPPPANPSHSPILDYMLSQSSKASPPPAGSIAALPPPSAPASASAEPAAAPTLRDKAKGMAGKATGALKGLGGKLPSWALPVGAAAGGVGLGALLMSAMRKRKPKDKDEDENENEKRGQSVVWDNLHPVDQAYLIGVKRACDDRGIPAAMLLAPELLAAMEQGGNA
jgi:hypothetical protein